MLPAPHDATWALALAGFAGGLAVGIGGMGGGALFTPALVLVFKLDPRVAIASDLVNALAMKPVGGAVHAARGTVSWKLARLLVAGGVPAAFFGAWLLNQLGDTRPPKGTSGPSSVGRSSWRARACWHALYWGRGSNAGAAGRTTSPPTSSSPCRPSWLACSEASWSG